MQKISKKEVDEIRLTGFRPQIVACIIHKKKMLFVFKEKYKLWQFPQGGIDNNETIEEASLRELEEELGVNFAKHLSINSIIGEDKIEFPQKLAGSRELKTDNGEDIVMIGKKYFFVVLDSSTEDLDIKETEFDDYCWLDYEDSIEILGKVYQLKKKEVMNKAINLAHRLELI